MPTCSILIAGHSHVTALGVPLVRETYELRQVGNGKVPAFGLVGGWPREDTDYWQEVASRSNGRTVAILWRGNQHFHHFLIMPTNDFDFVLESEPHLDADPAKPIVPEATIIEFMRTDMVDLDAIIEAIHGAGGQVVLCGTPPPKGDPAFVRSSILRESYFGRAAAKLGVDLETVEISPPLLLYKLWTVMQNSLRDVADRHGALFMPVPRRLRTPDGFLHPDYYANDATHANQAYGDVMLEELGQFLSPDMDRSVES